MITLRKDKQNLPGFIYSYMPTGREMTLGDIQQAIGINTASPDEIKAAMRKLSRGKRVRCRVISTSSGDNENTWTAVVMSNARAIEKLEEKRAEAFKAFRAARKVLALTPRNAPALEDNYRKALEACEAWKPTPRFPKNYDYDRNARQANGQKEVLKNLSDTPKSCAELYQLVQNEASCPKAVRKMVDTLVRAGKAVKVKRGQSVFYRRAS